MIVRLDEMRWPEMKESLNKPNVIIVPMGSTEEGEKIASAMINDLAEIINQVIKPS